MASMPDPLSANFWNRDDFDWADEVDDTAEDTAESQSVTSVETVSDHDYTDANTCTGRCTPTKPNILAADDQSLTSPPKFEYICDDIDEDLIQMPLVVSAPTSPSNPPSSFSQTVETEDEPVDENLEALFSNVAYEFNWRNDRVSEEPELHHFNWLGQGMFDRSATLPEESLAVILTDPKAPQATEDLRVESILRNAYRYLDPVIVCLDDEVLPSLWNLRGSGLQHAVKGRCFKHYTPHGQWHSDPEEPIDQNVVDAGGINNYLNPNVVIGNGFVSNRQVPSRWAYKNRLQEKIDNAPCGSSGLPRTRKPSPLRQIDSSTLPEIQTTPATLGIQECTTPNPSIEVEVEAENEIELCEPGPSYSMATPARLILETPVTITISKAKPSVTLDPSRDPDVYYSFPTSPFRYKDNKCKRIFKKAKRYIKNKLYQIRASL